MDLLDAVLLKIVAGFLVTLGGMAVRALFQVAAEVKELRIEFRQALEKIGDHESRILRLERKSAEGQSSRKPKSGS